MVIGQGVVFFIAFIVAGAGSFDAILFILFFVTGATLSFRFLAAC